MKKGIDKIGFVPLPEGDAIRAQHDESLVTRQLLDTLGKGESMAPWVLDTFRDPDFVHNIPEDMKKPENIIQFILNSNRFANLYGDRLKSILGDDVEMAVSVHADGRIRRKESGPRLLVEKLIEQGIDPRYVLYFRRTQPSEEPKPEYYWTSDYWETIGGLTREIPEEQRKTSVILCSSLEDINSDGGVIQDVNDDQGIAVRRINEGPYDQHRCLFTIKPKRELEEAEEARELRDLKRIAELRDDTINWVE